MTWDKFKEDQIVAVLKAVERHGYPSSDEPLCLLIEDTLDAAKNYLDPEDPTPCCYQHGVGAIGTNEKCPDIADND